MVKFSHTVVVHTCRSLSVRWGGSPQMIHSYPRTALSPGIRPSPPCAPSAYEHHASLLHSVKAPCPEYRWRVITATGCGNLIVSVVCCHLAACVRLLPFPTRCGHPQPCLPCIPVSSSKEKRTGVGESFPHDLSCACTALLLVAVIVPAKLTPPTTLTNLH